MKDGVNNLLSLIPRFITSFLLFNAVIIIAAVFLAFPANAVTVLMYHDINIDPDPQDKYSVTPLEFKQHMQYIKTHGYRVIPLNKIQTSADTDIVITFDDGYYSFIPHAFPILKQYKYPSTINVVVKWIQDGVIPDIKDRKALSYKDIERLSETGLVTFGSHTFDLHHFRVGVTQSDFGELITDFSRSRNMLWSNSHVHIKTIAWPYGKYTGKAVHAAYQLGFKYIQTSNHGEYSDNFDIPRYAVEKGVNFGRLLHDNRNDSNER